MLGRHTIDMRTATGKWLTARCEEYASDLGGDDALLQQQRTIVRLVVFDELVPERPGVAQCGRTRW